MPLLSEALVRRFLGHDVKQVRIFGIFGSMWDSGNRTGWTMAALVMLALSLGGCATSIADLPLVGLPADSPERPKEPAGYLPVHDLPPPRDQSAMDAGEQAKVEKELIAARDRQAVVTGPAAKTAATPPAKHSKKPQQSPSGRDKTEPSQPQG
jgi:hypothetical protein